MLSYATFVTSLANLLVVPAGDAGFQTVLPNIIDDAEQRIYRDLDFLTTLAQTTTALTAMNREFAAPQVNSNGLNVPYVVIEEVNVITPASVTNPNLGSRNQLVPTSKEVLNLTWPGSSGATVPEYYAMVGQTSILLGPWPDQAYTVEVVGTYRPAPMSPSNQFTFISLNLPDLLLAAAMVFGNGYLKNFGSVVDDPKAAVTWESHYQALKQSAEVEEARKKFTAAGWSTKQPSQIVTPPRM